MKNLLISINKFLRIFFLKTPFFIHFFNFRSKFLNTGSLIKKNGELIEIIDKNFYYLHLSRSDYYINGLERRFEKLRNEYFLYYFSEYNCKSLIDIGANIGEIPLSLSSFFKEFKYIGVEPSVDEFNCLSKNISLNLKDYEVLNKACGELQNLNTKFYLSSKSADSSIIKPDEDSTEVIIEQITIDHIIHTYNLNNVFIKIDTEGYEPETLKGINKSINKIRFISVDCGFERGIENNSTLPEVTSILFEKKFKMIKNHKKRMTYLFKNEFFE
jgi:FkbM family methyltransferase